jgi:hypothetical protein
MHQRVSLAPQSFELLLLWSVPFLGVLLALLTHHCLVEACLLMHAKRTLHPGGLFVCFQEMNELNCLEKERINRG